MFSRLKKLSFNRLKPDIHILARGGIGDALNFSARFDSLLEKYPDHRIYFHQGGYRQTPEFVAELFLSDRRIYVFASFTVMTKARFVGREYACAKSSHWRMRVIFY